MVSSIRAACGAALVTVLLAACAPPVATNLSTIEQRVFAPNCTFSSCHSTQGRAGQLVLEPGKSFGNLVGQRPEQKAAAEEGLLRVAPGDLLHSFLLVKLRDPMDRKYGDRMPQHQAPLDAEDLGAIEGWIRLGARND